MSQLHEDCSWSLGEKMTSSLHGMSYSRETRQSYLSNSHEDFRQFSALRLFLSYLTGPLFNRGLKPQLFVPRSLHLHHVRSVLCVPHLHCNFPHRE